MKVLVSGSRRWLDQGYVEGVLKGLPRDTILVHGACRGADSVAGFVAKILGFEVRPYPADWDKYSSRAGPIRNRLMLEQEHPDQDGVYLDRLIIFHDDPGLGKGTKDMHSLVLRSNQAGMSPPIDIAIFILPRR